VRAQRTYQRGPVACVGGVDWEGVTGDTMTRGSTKDFYESKGGQAGNIIFGGGYTASPAQIPQAQGAPEWMGDGEGLSPRRGPPPSRGGSKIHYEPPSAYGAGVWGAEPAQMNRKPAVRQGTPAHEPASEDFAYGQGVEEPQRSPAAGRRIPRKQQEVTGKPTGNSFQSDAQARFVAEQAYEPTAHEQAAASRNRNRGGTSLW